METAATSRNELGWELNEFPMGDDEPKAIPYVVEGLIREGSLTVVVGRSGSLKSMALADMAACVAVGKPWLWGNLDTIPWPPSRWRFRRTLRKAVLWVDMDNGSATSSERFFANGRAHLFTSRPALKWCSLPTPPLDASSSVVMKQLEDFIAQQGFGLVVVDCLQIAKGDADENTAEMCQPMKGFRGICERTGCSIILIHHLGKDGKPRGSTAIENLCDVMLLAERRGDILTLKPLKDRHGSIQPVAARFCHRNSGDTLAAHTFENVEQLPASRVPDGGQLVVAVIRERGESNQSQVCKTMADKHGWNRHRTQEELERLVKTGSLSSRSLGGTRGTVYSLPDTLPQAAAGCDTLP